MADIGQQLAEVPIGAMIEGLAVGIARAQSALDDNAIATLKSFNDQVVEIGGESRTLLECGLLPSFYFFSEATFELRVAMSMRSEESTSLAVGMTAEVTRQSSQTGSVPKQGKQGGAGAAGGAGGKKKKGAKGQYAKSGAAAFGASLNMENSRRFEFAAEGSTAVSVRLVSVPPPPQLLSFIQTRALAQAQAEAEAEAEAETD